MCDFIDDDGIDALEIGLILGFTDEMGEETTTKLSETPISSKELLKTRNEIFDEDE